MTTDLFELLVGARPRVEPLSTDAVNELRERVFNTAANTSNAAVAPVDATPSDRAHIVVVAPIRSPSMRRRLVVGGWLGLAAGLVSLLLIVRHPENPSVVPPAIDSASLAATVSPHTATGGAFPAEATTIEPTTTLITDLASVTVAANSTEISPTLLTTLNLPAGLTLSNGGTVTPIGPASVVIYQPSDPSRRYLLSWEVFYPCNNPDALKSGVSSNRAAAIAAMQASSTSAPVLAVERHMAQWCDGDQTVNVEADGADAAHLATLASTVTLSSDHNAVTFDLPTGYKYLSIARTARLGALKYTDSVRSVEIMVRSGEPSELEADASRPGTGTTTQTIDGRTVYTTSSRLTLSYDDHTLVFIDSTGLTTQELRAIVKGLTPADPALAPPVTDNCDDLHMCG